jgi:hypothetical protein
MNTVVTVRCQTCLALAEVDYVDSYIFGWKRCHGKMMHITEPVSEELKKDALDACMLPEAKWDDIAIYADAPVTRVSAWRRKRKPASSGR